MEWARSGIRLLILAAATIGRCIAQERFVDESHAGGRYAVALGLSGHSGRNVVRRKVPNLDWIGFQLVLSNKRLRLLQTFAPPPLTLSNFPLLARPWVITPPQLCASQLQSIASAPRASLVVDDTLF